MLLAPVVCFAELVLTGLWAVCAEHHARFLRPARTESNVPKLKSMWKFQGCRSRIAVLDPNYVHFHLVKGVEARGYIIDFVFAMLIGHSQVIINTSSEHLPVWFLRGLLTNVNYQKPVNL